MTDKERIEEMAGELLAYQPLIDIPFEQFYKVARAIVNLGYRKVNKDSIILTKEEYIDLSRNYVKEQKEQAVKEFAETLKSVVWEEFENETIKIKDLHGIINDILKSKYDVE